ncbi:serine hydrolase FSH [Limtongia smithiae]|uniref:serine hydrolase FSH n=1 Tax=Limtongia smithiae TaxID=1125753 RepID=UPI0034CE15D6
MGKILFLHGFTQSGTLFYKKTSALRKVLSKNGGHTALYPTAPIKLSVPDSADPEERATLQGQGIDDDSYAWWTKDDDRLEYEGIDKTWEFLTEYIRTEGPFVGVIGFSQGAALAAMLCTQITTLVPEHGPLKFAVLYSGFRSPLPQHADMYTPPISTTPTLHVLGSVDTVVSEERSIALWNACDSAARTMYRHPGGHFVPSSKEALNFAVGWIVATIEAAEKGAAAANGGADDDEEWESDFDNIGG